MIVIPRNIDIDNIPMFIADNWFDRLLLRVLFTRVSGYNFIILVKNGSSLELRLYNALRLNN